MRTQWPERISAWLQRAEAYALALSPPIAGLLAITLIALNRPRVAAVKTDRWAIWVPVMVVGLGGISALLTRSPQQALQGPVAVGILFVFWWMGTFAIRDPRRFWVDLQRGIGVVGALALAAIFAGLDLRFTVGGATVIVVAPVDTGTVSGLGANGLGPLLVYGGILALGRLFLTRGIERVEALAITATTLAAALSLGVRSALGGAMVGAAMLIPIIGAAGLLVVAVTAAAVFVLHPSAWHGFSELLRPESERLRWQVSLVTLAMVRDSPWLGVGPFHFLAHNARYMPPGSTPYELSLGPHNIYLRFVAEWGIPAAALLFAWILSWPLRLWRLGTRTWEWSLMAGLASFLFMGIFDDPLFTLHVSAPVFAGLGLVAARVRSARPAPAS